MGKNRDATHKRKQLHVYYSSRCGYYRILYFSANHKAVKSHNTVEDKLKINY